MTTTKTRKQPNVIRSIKRHRLNLSATLYHFIRENYPEETKVIPRQVINDMEEAGYRDLDYACVSHALMNMAGLIERSPHRNEMLYEYVTYDADVESRSSLGKNYVQPRSIKTIAYWINPEGVLRFRPIKQSTRNTAKINSKVVKQIVKRTTGLDINTVKYNVLFKKGA